MSYQNNHNHISSLISKLKAQCDVFSSYSKMIFSMTVDEYVEISTYKPLADAETVVTLMVEDMIKATSFYFGEFIHLRKPNLMNQLDELNKCLIVRVRPGLLRYLHAVYLEMASRCLELQLMLDKSELLQSNETLSLFLLDAIRERANACNFVNFGDGVWRPYTVLNTEPGLFTVKLLMQDDAQTVIDLKNTDVMMTEFRNGSE